ncbi:hypothetical protein FHL15_008157 [Xylaria flabelliformis]|uniref:C2H2-type domain-containing protein n=1 Tax=Xylaria flabelliformis TaxID=2512241 RepID=A0A553HSM1_9PEZI|nr:hypothetical protein FHL15_008157 [Xylaria flabelliformis]
MPVITILRGFKVHYAVLDAFLMANGLVETFGHPPVGTDYDNIAKLLDSKMGDTYVGKGARVVIPGHGPGYSSTFAYVAYGWMHVYAHRELDLETQIPKDCPLEFEKLRKEILSFEDDKNVRAWQKVDETGRMGLYIVYTENRNWVPKGFYEPAEGPVICEECNETCKSPSDRRCHLAHSHGIEIQPYELPEI